MDIVEEFGYPCVLKPVVGSWGRLMAKIDSEAAAEAILEHKSTLGNYEHKVFYIQEFVEKPGRDIRVLATDGEPVAAMVRSSDHWLTNAAKGASVDEFELDDRAKELVKQASDAVGGGLLGVDLMEAGCRKATPKTRAARARRNAPRSGRRLPWRRPREPGDDYTVHEVNHTVEFKALNDAVEADVPATVVDWLEAKVGGETRRGGDGMTYTAGVVGGSGFTGGELLRLLDGHPNFEVEQATSRSYERKTVGHVHPNLRHLDLRFTSPEDLESVDVLFTATPHGVSMEHIDAFQDAAAPSSTSRRTSASRRPSTTSGTTGTHARNSSNRASTRCRNSTATTSKARTSSPPAAVTPRRQSWAYSRCSRPTS